MPRQGLYMCVNLGAKSTPRSPVRRCFLGGDKRQPVMYRRAAQVRRRDGRRQSAEAGRSVVNVKRPPDEPLKCRNELKPVAYQHTQREGQQGATGEEGGGDT